MPRNQATRQRASMLPKCPTGIKGLDEITGGGVPRGRSTLICGGAGSGKTLLAMQFLVAGIQQFDEPGVFMAFEETAEDLVKNVASLGFDLNDLVTRKKLMLDHVRVERSEIEETGEYDLEGVFIRLGYAIDAIGAKRVVIDTIESIFGGLSNEGILRAELRRLFAWLKEHGVTAIITGERGAASLTRQGLEEYVSDCVILLDHELEEQISTRRLRVVKYRGSVHGTNEYPFLIDETGLSVLPITSVGLINTAPTERISSGIPRLDAMLGGKGFYRGGSVLITGTAGTGKTSMAAHFVTAACKRGERAMFFSFEESQHQIIRNMRSIGINLEPFVKKGLLRFEVTRSTAYGLEMHLAVMHKLVNDFNPSVVVFDPVTNLLGIGRRFIVKSMLTRLLDFLKMKQVTTLFTTLALGGSIPEETDVGISSLMDTWLLLRDMEYQGERNRGLIIVKSRGMAHSNQVREFRLTDHGVELIEVYVGQSTVLAGSARVQQEAREKAEQLRLSQERALRRREIEHKRRVLEAQLEEIHHGIESQTAELEMLKSQETALEKTAVSDRADMARMRGADAEPVREKKKIMRVGR